MLLQIEITNNIIHALSDVDGVLHRTTIAPGEDYSQQPPEVQVVCAETHTPDVIAAYLGQFPPTQPLPPQPAYALAWADLITSALYQRVLGLAQVALPVNTAMFLFTAAFQAYMGNLPHEVWASALSASAGHLAAAINTTDTPLTEEERDWVDLWNATHNLGLAINWEAP